VEAEELRRKLRGIIPPMVTPFTAEEEVDEAALRREVQFFLGCGVHGLAPTGSTGEGATLTPEECERVWRVVVEEVNGQVPVLAGIISDSTREAVAYGQRARAAGADALMVTPIHYYVPTEEGLYRFYRDLGETVGLPIVIYNVVEKATVRPELAQRLADLPLVVGIKQSGGDMHGLADMLRLIGDRLAILTAIDDLLFPSFVLGAQGAIAAILTVWPQTCVALWEAVQGGRYDEARRLHERLLPLVRAILGVNFPAAVRAALEILGRPVGPPRRPLVPLSPAEREHLSTLLTAPPGGGREEALWSQGLRPR